MSSFVPSPQLRYVKREVSALFGKTQTVKVLQQKWVIMNNWSEQAREWRDVPTATEQAT
jgi:hypothetical protein